MARALNQYTVRKLRMPTDKNINQDIEWLCNSLGFVTPRDQDKTAFRILKALVYSAKTQSGKTSEDLSKKVKPTVGSVIYHLKKLQKSGLVVKIDSEYELKMNSMLSTINEIQREINHVLDDVKDVAAEIDQRIGLETR